MNIEKVVVFGTGLMGTGISQVTAINGMKVLMFSNSLDSSNRFISYLQDNMKKKRITKEDYEKILKNVSFYSYSQLDMLVDVDLIIESTHENYEYKKSLFSKLNDYINETTIVASNTSTIGITKMASEINKPERFIGLHFFSPVPMMKLVEIVKGYFSTEDVLKKAKEYCDLIGKESVIVKDTPGFVFNRLFSGYIGEAISLLDEVDVSPEAIDSMIKHAIGSKIGPLKLADSIGIDVIKKSNDQLYDELKEQRFCINRINRMVYAKLFGKKTKQGFYNYK